MIFKWGVRDRSMSAARPSCRPRWTEVDFPATLDYKYGVLDGARPHCRLERKRADLNNVFPGFQNEQFPWII